MTLDEGKKAIEQLKAEGHSEEEILGAFYKMFQNDELTFEELDGVVNLMGYHLTDEFKNMSPEDQKTKGYEETDKPAEGVDEKEVEEAKEIDSNDEPEKDDESEKEDESEEKERAMKLFEGRK